MQVLSSYCTSIVRFWVFTSERQGDRVYVFDYVNGPNLEEGDLVGRIVSGLALISQQKKEKAVVSWHNSYSE